MESPGKVLDFFVSKRVGTLFVCLAPVREEALVMSVEQSSGDIHSSRVLGKYF